MEEVSVHTKGQTPQAGEKLGQILLPAGSSWP